MKVTVNGTKKDLPGRTTVHGLVELLGFGARQVVVEHNGEPVARADFGRIELEDDDVIEIVRPVAGG